MKKQSLGQLKVRRAGGLLLAVLGAACGRAEDISASGAAGGDLDTALGQLTASDLPTGGDRGSRVARLVAPLSGSVVGAARPAFRWTGPEVVVIEVCADRACARPVSAFLAVGQTARPPRAIGPGPAFWRVLSLGGNRLIQATASWELFVPRGAGASPTATRGLRYDSDADGFVDAAVRAQNALVPTDVVHVFAGGVGGISPTRDTTLTLDTTRFGVGMSAAGDTNGDGFADLAVADGRGVVIYAGSAAGPVATALAVIPPPANANVFGFGFQVSGAGDVNGDGYGDVAVADGFAQAWVFAGSATGPSSTPVWVLDRVPGRNVRLMTTGDLNGDGFGDLVVTDYGPDGTPQGFRYFRGSAAGLEAPTAGTFVLRPAFPDGSSGDVDGDGISDLVTAEGATLALFRGGSGFPSATPDQVTPIAARPGPLQFGDFNGDEAFDLAATTSTPSSESMYFTDDRIDIYPGGPGGLAAIPAQTLLERSVLEDNQLNFGLSLGTGDFNRDGREDLLVGAPPPFPTPFFETSPSAVFVFPGAAGGVGTTPAPRIDGTPGFGLRVSAGAPQSGP